MKIINSEMIITVEFKSRDMLYDSLNEMIEYSKAIGCIVKTKWEKNWIEVDKGSILDTVYSRYCR